MIHLKLEKLSLLLSLQKMSLSSLSLLGGDNDEENFLYRWLGGCKCLSGCYNGTTTAKDLNCSPGRIQRQRFRSTASCLPQQTPTVWDSGRLGFKRQKNIATCSMSQTITKQSPSVWDSGRQGCTFWVARDRQNLHIGLMFLES